MPEASIAAAILARVGAQFAGLLPDGDGVQVDDAEDALELVLQRAPSCGWRRDSCRGAGCRSAECRRRCGSCAHGGFAMARVIAAAGRRSSDGPLPPQQRLELAQLGRARTGERARRRRRGRRRSADASAAARSTNETREPGREPAALRAKSEAAIAAGRQQRARQPPLEARSRTAGSRGGGARPRAAGAFGPVGERGGQRDADMAERQHQQRRENDVEDRAERPRSSPASCVSSRA